MTTKNQQFLRRIDRVIAKGGDKPFDLYTLDLSTEEILREHGVGAKKDLTPHDRQKIKVSHNKIRQDRLEKIKKTRFTSKLWHEDKDVKCMRRPFSAHFFSQFSKAMGLYVDGKWKDALQSFKKAQVTYLIIFLDDCSG